MPVISMNKITAKLSIVVPIYNEAANLIEFNKSLVGELKQLAALGINDYEIIYVDDGSSDQSATIIKDLQKS